MKKELSQSQFLDRQKAMQIQLKQLNAKVNLLLHKQNITISITQKRANKTAETAQKQDTSTETRAEAEKISCNRVSAKTKHKDKYDISTKSSLKLHYHWKLSKDTYFMNKSVWKSTKAKCKSHLRRSVQRQTTTVSVKSSSHNSKLNSIQRYCHNIIAHEV